MNALQPDSALRTTTLRAGVTLTELGLGAAQFGNMHRVTSNLESEAAVIAAWDAGIRYFDTAPHYGLGLSERRLGRALQAYPRSDFVVSTKVGRLLVPSPETAGEQDPEGFVVPATVRRQWDFSRDGILRSVDASLERLGLDRLDIVYVHDPDEHWEAASTTGIDALIELRDQGVVRAIGAGMNQSRMLAEFIRRTDIDVVMVAGRYTLLDRGAEEELLPIAQERGVGVVAAGVYNSGLLSAEVVADDALFDYAPAPRALIDRTRTLAVLAEKYGITLPDAAVQFPLRHPAVTSVVLGTRTSDHVRSSISRAKRTIPEQFWKDLADAGQRSSGIDVIAREAAGTATDRGISGNGR